MSDLISNLAQWSIDIAYTFGYVGLFILSFLSSLHLPIPMQLIMPLAGFLTSQGRFSLVPVLMASTAGAVVAALFWYYLALWFGEVRLQRVIGRVERFKIVSRSDLDLVSRVFARHGRKAIVLGHLLPVGGSLISIPAGVTRMSIPRFVIYTILGSAVWNAVFVALGWVLGAEWALVQQYQQIFEYVTFAIVVVVILWFLWRRWLSLLRPVEKSDMEMGTVVFVDRLKEIHPNIDGEELYKAIIGYLRSATETAESEAKDGEQPEDKER